MKSLMGKDLESKEAQRTLERLREEFDQNEHKFDKKKQVKWAGNVSDEIKFYRNNLVHVGEPIEGRGLTRDNKPIIEQAESKHVREIVSAWEKQRTSTAKDKGDHSKNPTSKSPRARGRYTPALRLRELFRQYTEAMLSRD
mmetsp:Transcript_17541/g.31474  ORF Transcript_17541/g.31474 Transcript_17541/m.31474 type:complete len:141 (+) Transcript_17541:163-585(+)